MAELKRTLNLFEVTFFATGVILGAGIYAIVGEAAGEGGNMLWLSFLLASFTALMTAFSYAEFASMFPKSGGEYVYLKESLGDRIATLLGAIVAMTGIVSAATIAIGFAGYFGEFLDISSILAAIAIIALILLINILGIRQSSTTNIVFTIIEIAGLSFVIYSARNKIGDVDYMELPPDGIKGIVIGSALSFFAFIGFEDTVKLAEETKKPERNIPRALFIAGFFVAVIYLLVVIAAISSVPYGDLAGSSSPLSMIVETEYGRTGVLIIAAIALFATSNSLLSNMLGASRVIYNMAKEVSFLKWFSFVSPKRKTPVFALTLAALIAAAFSLIGDIKQVALITNFFVFLTFILVNVGIIVLRLKDPDRERPFRIPFQIGKIPLIPIVAIVLTVIMIVFAILGMIR